jgi:hypothetical protein
MMTKRLALIVSMIFIAAVALGACATMGKPTAENFQTPIITLESFEVPQYDGFWHYGADAKPVKGAAGSRGAPLPLSFLISIKNPNSYPILLEGITYTVVFDKDFALYTGNNSDAYWIPAGKTDHIRLNTMITTASAQLSVLVTGGFKLKEKGWTAWDALQRWWEGVPNYTVPVSLKEATFTFKANGVFKAVPFEATFQ